MTLQQIPVSAEAGGDVRGGLLRRYQEVRAFTHALCEPLVPEDYVIQSMPDVSPAKWHLAHTSWFFETFLLSRAVAGYEPFHPRFGYLFNSYYVQAGERHCRPKRGLLSRPTVSEVYDYRRHVDQQMSRFLVEADDAALGESGAVVEIGLHHEQQHQELLLTDIKHVFSVNPLYPVYRARAGTTDRAVPPMQWVGFEEGVRWIGHEGDGFAYDNESPRHRRFVDAFKLGSRLVTCGEYLQFIEDGGYRKAELWLSEGWNTVQSQEWEAPLYWVKEDGRWMQFTLSGLREVEDGEPVCHVSLFEADAYARWAGARLATEAEWEVAAQEIPGEAAPVRGLEVGNYVEDGTYHPVPVGDPLRGKELVQMFGDVWEWTRSQYEPYPGYRPPPGALGEYNGKFMCNQFVLRGGSCATSRTHIRRTYRNFFPPDARWQFTGIRLAQDG
jgi:ergothioneine biosynthesis protein EgtB